VFEQTNTVHDPDRAATVIGGTPIKYQIGYAYFTIFLFAFSIPFYSVFI
jgi:hypothetical protein